MVSSKRLINGSCRSPASLTPLHLARQSAILSCPLPPLCSLLVLLPSQLSLWRPVYSNGCTSASSPHWLPLASVTLSKPCPWGGHKGPAQCHECGSLPMFSFSAVLVTARLPSRPWWHCSLLVCLLPPPSAAPRLSLPVGTAQGTHLGSLLSPQTSLPWSSPLSCCTMLADGSLM